MKERKAIILKGGGVKGLAFAGALQVLEKHFKFEIHAGASAGAIVAVLMAAGYNAGELVRILEKTRFEDFLDTSPILRIPRLFFRGGMHSGDAFRKWIRQLLNDKIPKRAAIALADLPGSALIFASTARGRLCFDSRGQNKDTSADFALRCSMAIPYFFDSVSHGGDRVMDGGVLNNFPIRAVLEEVPQLGDDFIALYLGSETLPNHKTRPLIVELLSMWLGQDETLLVDKYEKQTVTIDTRPIRTTDFALTDDEKEFLVLQGKAAALQYLQQIDVSYPKLAQETARALRKAFEQREKVIRDRNQRKWRRRGAMATVAALAGFGATAAWGPSLTSITDHVTINAQRFGNALLDWAGRGSDHKVDGMVKSCLDEASPSYREGIRNSWKKDQSNLLFALAQQTSVQPPDEASGEYHKFLQCVANSAKQATGGLGGDQQCTEASPCVDVERTLDATQLRCDPANGKVDVATITNRITVTPPPSDGFFEAAANVSGALCATLFDLKSTPPGDPVASSSPPNHSCKSEQLPNYPVTWQVPYRDGVMIRFRWLNAHSDNNEGLEFAPPRIGRLRNVRWTVLAPTGTTFAAPKTGETFPQPRAALQCRSYTEAGTGECTNLNLTTLKAYWHWDVWANCPARR